MAKKYLFITGGVCSSLGKGILTSSLANLIERRGGKVSVVKVDPYINVDAGTISPYQHGEVYVTRDGMETDLDLGNYYRFTSDVDLGRDNSITTGQIYQDILKKERKGEFLGKTVQMIPHLTDSIISRIEKVAIEDGITLIEIGGTVGDYESIPFLEAIRQMILKNNKEDVLSIHMTLVPEVIGDGIKTKPTQHSVKELRTLGINPDIVVARLKGNLDEESKKKIALFTNVKPCDIFYVPDLDNIYKLPNLIKEQEMDKKIFSLLDLDVPIQEINTREWDLMLAKMEKKNRLKVKIAVVGKYSNFADAYKSLYEALKHAAIENDLELNIVNIDFNSVEKISLESFKDCDGILIPGGFGERGISVKIEAIRIARENNIPIFGICLGMQLFIIEYARNVLGSKNADSTEFNKGCTYPVIHLLDENNKEMGGTMRLGLEKIFLEEGSKIREIYGTSEIEDIHRHRYEFNNRYIKDFKDTSLFFSAYTKHEDGKLVEAVEYKDHPWGIAVQYHPEFLSKPVKASVLFKDFIKASFKNKK